MMLNCIKKEKLAVLMIFYKALLESIWVQTIFTTHVYQGFVFRGKIEYCLYSYILLIIVIICMPRDLQKPSTIVFVMLTTIIFIPFAAVSWMIFFNPIYISTETLCFLIVALILNVKFRIHFPYLLKSNDANVIIKILFILYMVISFVTIYKMGGISIKAFSFSTVYSLRGTISLSSFYTYLRFWSIKAMFPFFLIYYLDKKKFLNMSLCVLIQLLQYLCSGEKTLLLSIGFIFLAIFCYNRRFDMVFVGAFALMNLGAFLIKAVVGIESFFSLVSYRLCALPALIATRYFDYFGTHEFLHYSESFLGTIIRTEYKYDIAFATYINSYYNLTSTESNANTGIFSDAYANGGIIAMLVVSILLGYILKYIDKTRRDDIRLEIGIFSYYVVNMMDMGFLTNLSTNGMVIALILIYIYRCETAQICSTSLKKINVFRRVLKRNRVCQSSLKYKVQN